MHPVLRCSLWLALLIQVIRHAKKHVLDLALANVLCPELFEPINDNQWLTTPMFPTLFCHTPILRSPHKLHRCLRTT